MQKINHIHYALLILGLSGATITRTITQDDVISIQEILKECLNQPNFDVNVPDIKKSCLNLRLEKNNAQIKQLIAQNLYMQQLLDESKNQNAQPTKSPEIKPDIKEDEKKQDDKTQDAPPSTQTQNNGAEQPQ